MAFDKGAWSEAYALLGAADVRAPLDPDDLDRLATAAYLIGEDSTSIQARTRAHAAFLERGEPIRAARSAFWLAFTIVDKPDQRAQAAGWLARAQRLIDDVRDRASNKDGCSAALRVSGWPVETSRRRTPRSRKQLRSALDSATATSWRLQGTARVERFWP